MTMLFNTLIYFLLIFNYHFELLEYSFRECWVITHMNSKWLEKARKKDVIFVTKKSTIMSTIEVDQIPHAVFLVII